MRGLVIRQPWIDLILAGKKTWEMRSRPTKVKGVVALIRAKSGLVFGTARLVDSGVPLVREDYMNHGDKHAIPEAMLDEVMRNGWVHPWVLAEIRVLPRPVPYRHNSGAVTFVNLDPSVVAAVRQDHPGRVTSPVAPISSPALPVAEANPSRKATRATAIDQRPKPDRRNDAVLTFAFRPQTALAYGRPLPDGRFLVLEGSTAMRFGSPRVKRDTRDRDRLVGEGVLVSDGDDRYRFARDHAFSSCSKAAGVIKDGNASGPSLWKDVSTGKSLRDCRGEG